MRLAAARVRWVRLVVSALGLVLASGSAAADAPGFDFKGVARLALTEHIQPGYAAFAVSAAKLEHATAACAAGSAFDYTTLRSPFRDTITAWGRVAHIEFGAVAQGNRYERIFFWLDRKGIARRQVARALRNRPDDYRDPAILGERSIGVQGLSAFELVMLAEPQGTDGGFRCAYARAIAANVARIAKEVAASWRDGGVWAEHWLSSGPGNPSFLTPAEPTYVLFRGYLAHTERIRDVELARPLGMARRGRKLRGPFGRSDLTMAFLAARLAGLRSSVIDTGIAAETIRVARARRLQEAVENMTEVTFELDYLVGRAARHATVPDFFATDRSGEAAALGFPLKEVHNRAENALARVTDLPLGFNASDGD